jgi:hypothetical protein
MIKRNLKRVKSKKMFNNITEIYKKIKICLINLNYEKIFRIRILKTFFEKNKIMITHKKM